MDGWPVPDPIVEHLFIKPAMEEGRDAAVEPGDLASVFGTLRPWDRFFLSSNGNANSAFHVFNVALVRGYEVSFYMPRYGRMFLQNAAHVPTFVTNAALDLVVYTEALAPALARYDDILESVTRGNAGLQRGSPARSDHPQISPGRVSGNFRHRHEANPVPPVRFKLPRRLADPARGSAGGSSRPGSRESAIDQDGGRNKNMRTTESRGVAASLFFVSRFDFRPDNGSRRRDRPRGAGFRSRFSAGP